MAFHWIDSTAGRLPVIWSDTDLNSSRVSSDKSFFFSPEHLGCIFAMPSLILPSEILMHVFAEECFIDNAGEIP